MLNAFFTFAVRKMAGERGQHQQISLFNPTSLKFGKNNKFIKYSKAEMASVIDKQSREFAELKARDVQNAKDKAEMKADNAEMKAEIEALKKQVEALAAKK